MLASIFGVTGLIVWIVVIVAVIALLKGKNKTLYKSDSNRMLCGICGGIGECLNIISLTIYYLDNMIIFLWQYIVKFISKK